MWLNPPSASRSLPLEAHKGRSGPLAYILHRGTIAEASQYVPPALALVHDFINESLGALELLASFSLAKLYQSTGRLAAAASVIVCRICALDIIDSL